MDTENDGQHRSQGRATNDGQIDTRDSATKVGQERGADAKTHHIGLDYNLSTTSGSAGGLYKPGEKHGGADDQK